jgi:two-component system, NtrC family, response regulator HydG
MKAAITMNILLIDDEESIRFTFESFLVDEGHSVVPVHDYACAMKALTHGEFDLVFADILLGDKTGIDLLRELRNQDSTAPVVMITGYPNIETAAEAVRLGAFDYIPKPVTQEMLLRVTRQAARHNALNLEMERYRNNLDAIFRSVQEAIITVDIDMRITDANEAAMRLCALPSNPKGERLDSVTRPCSGACISSVKETLRLRQPVHIHRAECRRSGKADQVITLRTSPLVDGKGEFRGVVMVGHDETRLDDLERNLKERNQCHNLIGRSEKMQQLYSLIEDLADVPSTVLINGESGTGKELVAEALHFKGSRRDQPLVKVNCSALSESLLESELFGHVKGAFTGAISDKAGRFQKADGGTIFLDEIGDITPGMQLRLLRVLQEKEFERVGDSRPIKVDVRIVAATNRNLMERVRQGAFREDLYYRLNVVRLVLPPLKERPEDIPLLTEHFLGKFRKKFNKTVGEVSPDVMKMFLDHSWPGNIRQLEHTLEHAVIVCRQSFIIHENLPADFLSTSQNTSTQRTETATICEEDIRSALERSGGNKSKAARLLGISRRTIYRKIRFGAHHRDRSQKCDLSQKSHVTLL